VAITGAEVSADPIQPWNFTPIGLAAQAASHAGGINSKTPALVVENKITDSQSNEFIGGGVVVVQGESFRTASGSVDSFVAMAKKAVKAALETSANPTPTGQ
jgi:pyruvate-formate lyase-activating enzyme